MKYVCVLMLGLAALASANSTQPAKSKYNPAVMKILGKYGPGYRTFSINLYKLLSKEAPGDLVISPLSTHHTLGLVLAGARGRTQFELRKAMSYNLNSTESKKLWIFISKSLNYRCGTYKPVAANALFVDNDFPVREGYKAIAENHYRSKILTVDFLKLKSAIQSINAWVKKYIPKIDKFLEPYQVTKSTRLVLANVIQISVKWQNPFSADKTTTGAFYVNEHKTKTINYMRGCIAARFAYNEVLGAKFLELPFDGVNKSLVIVLPNNRLGLPALETKLNQILAFSEELEEEHVNVTLPKFSFNTLLQLKPILQKLGVRKIFNPNQADLSGITEKRGLFINGLIQKAFINVNEGGLEVGAAGGAPANKTVANSESQHIALNFNADHPFLFYLKVAPGTPLLIGRVNNPEVAKPQLNPRYDDEEIENEPEDDLEEE